MATGNRKTSGKRSVKEGKCEERQIEALPFVGTAEDQTRDWWAVPKRGGYVGGCMTGKAAATAYLSFLRENDCGDSGMLQHVALDMLGRPRSESLMGQAVGFFSHLGNILRQFAPLLDIEEDDDQIRAMFRRGLNMNGPRTAAYIKELRTEASLDEQFVWTVSSLSARGLAILKRIMTHLENQPPGTPPVTKEQIVGWLREGGASEDEVYLCLKEMGAA